MHELYVYELLKFVTKAVRKTLPNELNSTILLRDNAPYETGSVVRCQTSIPYHRTNIKRNSLHYRANILYNKLRGMEILPLDIDFLTDNECELLQHRLQYQYILGNKDIVSCVFD